VLRYVFPPNTPDSDVAAFVPKLVAFANVTDATLATAGFLNPPPTSPPASPSSSPAAASAR